MTSAPYSAADALRMGLVDRFFSREDFWQRVRHVAEKIARHPSEILQGAKRLLNASEDVDLKNGCALEDAMAGTLWKPAVSHHF